MVTRLLFVSLLILALTGCSIGKGYLFEPTGMTKCIVASAEEGRVEVNTPMNAYGSILLEGKNVTYHGVHKDYCEIAEHGQ